MRTLSIEPYALSPKAAATFSGLGLTRIKALIRVGVLPIRLYVSVGGFLGMGDHYVVVRPSAISLKAKDNKWHATMNVNADQLKAAPEYKYSN